MENLTIEAVKEEKRVLMRWQETVKHMMKGKGLFTYYVSRERGEGGYIEAILELFK